MGPAGDGGCSSYDFYVFVKERKMEKKTWRIVDLCYLGSVEMEEFGSILTKRLKI